MLAQAIDRVAQIVELADQRVVIAQGAGAGGEDVAIKGVLQHREVIDLGEAPDRKFRPVD